MLPSPAVTRAHASSLRRRLLLLAAVVLMAATALGLSACGSDDGADLPDGVVARVGDAPITQAQLDRLIEQSRASAKAQGQQFPAENSSEFATVRRQAVEQLVNLTIIRLEARRCGTPCRVTRSQVDAELQRVIKSQFGGKRAQLDKFLKQRKITLQEAREQLRAGLEQQRIQTSVTKGVRFTAADARKYYDGNRAQYRVAPSRTISHILVKTKAEADRLYGQATPQNFARLARKYSIDTGSKPRGGDLGPQQRGQLVPEFEKVAFTLRPDVVSKPVKTQFGWHLILVRSISRGRTIPFREARPQIEAQQLSQKKSEAYQSWVTKTLKEWQGRTVYASDDLKPQTETTTTGGVTAP